MAYKSNLPNGVPGFEPAVGGPLANKLGARDFNILHIKVGAATANAITTIPASLTSNTFWNPASAATTRKVLISDTTIGGGPPIFLLNHRQTFNMNTIDYSVKKEAVEIWEINNTSPIAHPFHIIY